VIMYVSCDIDLLGMNQCMNHDWSIGWILTWDCYAR